MNQTILAGALSAVSLSLAAPAFAGPVLDKVKANDVVVCGVNTAAPGFSNADSKAIGRAWTSITAVHWPQQFWPTPIKLNSFL